MIMPPNYSKLQCAVPFERNISFIASLPKGVQHSLQTPNQCTPAPPLPDAFHARDLMLIMEMVPRTTRHFVISGSK